MRAKKQARSIDSREKALLVAGLALDKKAADVAVLEVRDLVPYADYFVICTGTSTQQVKTIVEHVEDGLRKRKIRKLAIEGLGHAHWVLVDYGDVIVHVFEPETREYYELEKLWLDAPRVGLDEAEAALDG